MPERRTAAPATTDQTIKGTLDPELQTEQERKAWLDLSVTQVVAGALAAMTAAALGSRFSATGTVVGAALASVIAAVAGALYTASLRRTGETVRAVLGGRQIRAAGTQPVPHGSTAVSPRSLRSPADATVRASRRRVLVVSSVVGAMAAFALAAGALTLYETFTGHALSGGSGTTFSQVQQDEREDPPTDKQAPTPSESADPSPTAEPSAEASPTPEAEPTPTAEPSAETSPQPSVTSQAEPSATVAPPSVAPSRTARTPG